MKVFHSFDEVVAFLDEERRNTPWIVRRYQDVNRRLYKVKRVPSLVRNVYERARYGYGHRDLWSFDHYLARVVSRAATDLAENGHGYPGTEEFPDEESWKNFLRELSRDLEGYDVWDGNGDGYERGREAMIRFAKNFGSMWD